MTSEELYKILRPTKSKTEMTQLTNDGLIINMSSYYDRFIRMAGRTNAYAGDVYFSIKEIETAFHEFDVNKQFTPIWLGFRRYGVDHAGFILNRIDEANLYLSLHREYFALYSINVEFDEPGWYNVTVNYYEP